MSKSGHFVVVEGLEGAGKSTALQTIQDFLLSRVPELVITREPGGTQVGEAIRTILKQPLNQPLDARAELLLFYAARVQLLEEVILPALARGAWVLADRFELSTYAYQVGGRQLDRDFVNHLSSVCLQGLRPDLTFFLDLSPELGLKRALLRGKKDRIEQEPLSFFQAVFRQYHLEIAQHGSVQRIDATQSLTAVQDDIMHTLSDYLQQHVVA